MSIFRFQSRKVHQTNVDWKRKVMNNKISENSRDPGGRAASLSSAPWMRRSVPTVEDLRRATPFLTSLNPAHTNQNVSYKSASTVTPNRLSSNVEQPAPVPEPSYLSFTPKPLSSILKTIQTITRNSTNRASETDISRSTTTDAENAPANNDKSTPPHPPVSSKVLSNNLERSLSTQQDIVDKNLNDKTGESGTLIKHQNISHADNMNFENENTNSNLEKQDLVDLIKSSQYFQTIPAQNRQVQRYDVKEVFSYQDDSGEHTGSENEADKNQDTTQFIPKPKKGAIAFKPLSEDTISTIRKPKNIKTKVHDHKKKLPKAYTVMNSQREIDNYEMAFRKRALEKESNSDRDTPKRDDRNFPRNRVESPVRGQSREGRKDKPFRRRSRSPERRSRLLERGNRFRERKDRSHERRSRSRDRHSRLRERRSPSKEQVRLKEGRGIHTRRSRSREVIARFHSKRSESLGKSRNSKVNISRNLDVKSSSSLDPGKRSRDKQKSVRSDSSSSGSSSSEEGDNLIASSREKNDRLKQARKDNQGKEERLKEQMNMREVSREELLRRRREQFRDELDIPPRRDLLRIPPPKILSSRFLDDREIQRNELPPGIREMTNSGRKPFPEREALYERNAIYDRRFPLRHPGSLYERSQYGELRDPYIYDRELLARRDFYDRRLPRPLYGPTPYYKDGYPRDRLGDPYCRDARLLESHEEYMARRPLDPFIEMPPRDPLIPSREPPSYRDIDNRNIVHRYKDSLEQETESIYLESIRRENLRRSYESDHERSSEARVDTFKKILDDMEEDTFKSLKQVTDYVANFGKRSSEDYEEKTSKDYEHPNPERDPNKALTREQTRSWKHFMRAKEEKPWLTNDLFEIFHMKRNVTSKLEKSKNMDELRLQVLKEEKEKLEKEFNLRENEMKSYFERVVMKGRKIEPQDSEQCFDKRTDVQKPENDFLEESENNNTFTIKTGDDQMRQDGEKKGSGNESDMHGNTITKNDVLQTSGDAECSSLHSKVISDITRCSNLKDR